MRHLSEDQLAALALDLAPPRLQRHLPACAPCRARLAEFQQVLALAAAAPMPEPPADLGDQVWRRLQASLGSPVRPALRLLPRAWAIAVSLALVAGLAWRLHARRSPRPPAPAATAQAAAAPSPLLLAAVAQHLDRSQVFLVALDHAASDPGATAAVDVAPEQRWARALLASNRLYQQNARFTGDVAMAHLLASLEPVLLEIAHCPRRVPPTAWRHLQASIASSGILFKLRVADQSLQSQLHPQQSNGTL
ncbi:MAG TPA: hypothetical protein VMV31_06140 [Terriglobales bacterium]|nr:hypothetical protein [Terriglobales bacterium]